MKIEQVQFLSAVRQYGHPDEPTRLLVKFNLIPVPDLSWSELFGYALQHFNEKKNNSELEDFDSEENEDDSVWKFSKNRDDKELVAVLCHSTEEIESLHKALKKLARRTNDEYPKHVKRLQADHEAKLAEEKEIERLKKNLKSDI